MAKALTRLPARAISALGEFFRLQAAGGIVLVVAAIIAMLLANSSLRDFYVALLEVPVQVRVGELDIAKPLLLWINDFLMAIFFLLVALEIKREAVEGQLSSRAQLLLPMVCAIGGMLVPALIYIAFNHDSRTALHGWAIPAATDIAFALGILSLLGSRVPIALKVLLSAIAVIDDLGAIVIIALFYGGKLSLLALGGAVVSLVVLFAMNRMRVMRVPAYLLVGLVMWVFVLKSGVHATLAGVATGLMIPLRHPDNPEVRPLASLEHALHPWVAFAIMPVFAFANAGLYLGDMTWGDALQAVPLGVALGLLLGKPIGVFGAAAIAIGMGWSPKPEGCGWAALFGMSVLCGIGFTMSLFIGSLAFAPGSEYALTNRIGILAGSIAAAIIGLLWLQRTLPRPERAA
ncbi:Na+/H+ antiporter NhaA [Chiayiivirga flava]|uniref:Na(+)/H(+) antiporter NhaA n=1 Tax=Chiayiivirga flava TaxID=659595 RepID=A0A7W8G0C5_9GAMM|nr:Na+/H+ antiporter NhaA [Chiayiivirga flava]MBB5207593.1 NhaA family Na+:H+ antiporter [Chiayiivirga flava]